MVIAVMAYPTSPITSFTRSASEQEARLLASKIVGPEHVFLALLWPEATNEPTILRAYGITIQRARVAMHEMATWGGEPLRGRLPVSIAAERAYEIAERYAEGRPLRHSDVVIGVLSVRSPVLERLLMKLGLTRSQLRMAVQQVEAKRSHESQGGQLPDALPLPSSAPNVVDLRTPSKVDPGLALPGNVEPEPLEWRVDALSARVDALTNEVHRLLANTW